MALMALVYPMLFLLFFDIAFMDYATIDEDMILFDVLMKAKLIFITISMIQRILNLMGYDLTIRKIAA